MSPVTIYKALNPADAQLVCSRLEAAGFHSFIAAREFFRHAGWVNIIRPENGSRNSKSISLYCG